MRLIDADALKEDLFIKFGNQLPNGLLDEVDNAPTVTNGTYEQGFRVGAYGRLDEIRPHGKWEYNQYDGNPNIGNWHCSNCHNICCEMKLAHDNYNFCPNCGADMRGKEE